MTDIHDLILAELSKSGIKPLLGDLIPEAATADLLGYNPRYFNELARTGKSPLLFVMRGNRRFYSVTEIARLMTKQQGI